MAVRGAPRPGRHGVRGHDGGGFGARVDPDPFGPVGGDGQGVSVVTILHGSSLLGRHTCGRTAAERVAVVFLCMLGLACRPAGPSAADATAGIDSLNAALVRASRAQVPQAYAALCPDTAPLEWPDCRP